MNSDSINQQGQEVRQIAFKMLERAKNDPTYLARLKSEPEVMLAEEGLSDPVSKQLIGELGLAEVQGYIEAEQSGCSYTCDYSCNTGTCMVTYCSNTPYTGGSQETR